MAFVVRRRGVVLLGDEALQKRCEAECLTAQLEVAIVAYRLVQEARSNVVKHAKASTAEVSQTAADGGAEVLIAVRDDGIDFDPTRVPGGSLGLAGMRERVSGAGGRMRIRSRLDRETRVTFRLPLADGQDEGSLRST